MPPSEATSRPTALQGPIVHGDTAVAGVADARPPVTGTGVLGAAATVPTGLGRLRAPTVPTTEVGTRGVAVGLLAETGRTPPPVVTEGVAVGPPRPYATRPDTARPARDAGLAPQAVPAAPAVPRPALPRPPVPPSRVGHADGRPLRELRLPPSVAVFLDGTATTLKVAAAKVLRPARLA